MSGYAVIVRRDTAHVAPDELRAPLELLRARGPHGDATVVDGPVGVASTLLDVGDPRLAPAWARAGRFLVAGQIRLDAREALIDAMRRAGAASTEDDADVQLFARAWQLWQERALERVLGDFSVVVHDFESGVVTLARDPFGVRLLFYHVGAHQIVASNTLRVALHAAPSRALDDDAIADFITEGFNELPERTTFQSVLRVPPAHWVRVHRDGRRELHRYWSLPHFEVDRSRSPDAIVREFRALLEASVRDRIRTPRLTVFMSGGVDSTTLAAIATRELGDPSRVLARTAWLPTFHPHDDTARARLVATTLGVRHELVDLGDYGYFEGTGAPRPDTPEPYDDPDFASIRDELLHASTWAPVVLWGEDPDAFLAPPHLGELLRGSSAPRLALDILSYAWRERARPHLAVRDLVRGRLGRIPPPLHSREAPAWLRADLRAHRAERLAARTEPTHPTRSAVASRLDQSHWQPFLESYDAGFTDVPIDVRHPYLDLRLVHFALAAPPIPWMQRKKLLREAARGLIPEAVRVAPKRGVPGLYEKRIAQWWARQPAPFVPSDALARYLDVRALPVVSATSSVNDTLAHLRLRILDRWLRVHG